jgi:hypothetical protein
LSAWFYMDYHTGCHQLNRDLTATWVKSGIQPYPQHRLPLRIGGARCSAAGCI